MTITMRMVFLSMLSHQCKHKCKHRPEHKCKHPRSKHKCKHPSHPAVATSTFTPLTDAMGKNTEALVSAIRQIAFAGGGCGGGGGVAPALDLPVVGIAAEAEAWIEYAVDRDRRRNAWPGELSTKNFDLLPFDIPEYRMYLKSTKHVKPSSITLYIQGVTYWRRLLVVPEGITELEVIPSLWIHKNIRTLFSLPILAPEHPTSHKIAMSLSHYIGDLLLRCDAGDTPYHDKLAKTLRLTFQHFIKSLLAKSKAFKKQRAIEKRQRESELRSRLQHYLPAIKVGIKNTFIDMHNRPEKNKTERNRPAVLQVGHPSMPTGTAGQALALALAPVRTLALALASVLALVGILDVALAVALALAMAPAPALRTVLIFLLHCMPSIEQHPL